MESNSNVLSKKLDCILLIDDNESDNFYNKIIIEDSGITNNVISVESGIEGLEYLCSNTENDEYIRPNLIFLDINMPKMNGFEFLKEYEKIEDKYKSDAVVMMLTTSSNPEDIKRAKSLGITEFYTKVLTDKVLGEVMAKYF
jgi:CheY-like chemotaxis protein